MPIIEKAANLPGYAHDFESSAKLVCLDITHHQTIRGQSNNTCHMMFMTTDTKKSHYSLMKPKLILVSFCKYSLFINAIWYIHSQLDNVASFKNTDGTSLAGPRSMQT